MWPPIVLSGPMFSGKTTLAELLHLRRGYVVLRARDVLRTLSGSALESREELQRYGAELEYATQGRWLGEAAAALSGDVPSMRIVVDAARTELQVAAARNVLEGTCHIHLTADRSELRRRFSVGQHDLVEPASLELALEHPVEQEAAPVGAGADLSLDSGRSSPDELLAQIEAFIRRD